MIRRLSCKREIVVLLSAIGLTHCSLLFGDDLDGLKPFPHDAGEDGRATQADGNRSDGATGDGAGVDAVADVSVSDSATDRLLADGYSAFDVDADGDGNEPSDSTSDRLEGALDAASDVAVGDAAAAPDASVDVGRDVDDRQDAGPDAEDGDRDTRSDGASSDAPSGDGKIVGFGNWVVAGTGSRGSYEVRGWMVPTTPVRATTRSRLTIEGYLQ